MSFQNWIGQAILKNDVNTIDEFPQALMDSWEFQLISYMKEHKTKYGSLPSLDSIKKDVDNYELLINPNPPNFEMSQLLSEAKKSNYTRKTKELLSKALNGGTNNFLEVANEIKYLDNLVRPASKPKQYDDLSIYTPSTSKLYFKYNHLENAANGLLGGEIALFVGQAKAKKTWITLDLALHAYIKQNKKVYFTSLEMNSSQIQQRVNAMIGQFNPNVFRKGTVDELLDAQKMFEFNNKDVKNKTTGEFIIPERMTNTIFDVIRDVEEYEPDVIFLDSIYLFQNERGIPIQSDWGSLATMIGQLKALARDKDIQVIANSQLKREAKEDVEADDVAYSHAFVQTCDLLVAVQSDNQTNQERSILKIIASRNGTNGYTGFVDFDFNNCTISEHIGKFLKEKMDNAQ